MFATKYTTPEAKAQARSIRRKVRAAKKSGNAEELAKWQAALAALQTVPAEKPTKASTEAKGEEVKAESENVEVTPATKPAVIHPAPKPAPKPGKKVIAKK